MRIAASVSARLRRKRTKTVTVMTKQKRQPLKLQNPQNLQYTLTQQELAKELNLRVVNVPQKEWVVKELRESIATQVQKRLQDQVQHQWQASHVLQNRKLANCVHILDWSLILNCVGVYMITKDIMVSAIYKVDQLHVSMIISCSPVFCWLHEQKLNFQCHFVLILMNFYSQPWLP